MALFPLARLQRYRVRQRRCKQSPWRGGTHFREQRSLRAAEWKKGPKSMFFFEKKNQKTFIRLSAAADAGSV
jgi:hypothetical protein